MNIIDKSYEMTSGKSRKKTTKSPETTIPILPQVGLYTCPMCQGRGVCTTRVADFEGKSSLVSADDFYQAATSSLDNTSSWLPVMSDFSSNLGLQQAHPSSEVSYKSELRDSADNVSHISRTLSSAHQIRASAMHSSSSSSLKKFPQRNATEERILEIWPNIIADSENSSEKSRRPPTYTISLRELPAEKPKTFHKRHTVSHTGSVVALRGRASHAATKKTSLQGSTSTDAQCLVLEEARPLYPQETLRVAMMGLQSSDWEEVVQGLQGIVKVSKWQPALIDPHVAFLYRVIVSLLRGLRSHVTRVACQAARELFRTMQSTNRPEFDELVGALLGRTADLNRFIRHDANDALDAMVTYLPPLACVRALLARGCSNRHPLVRSTTARLLTCCSVVAGPGGLFAQCTKPDARTSLMSGAASLLADPNQETRSSAKKLFESLVQHEDFDSIFQSSVDEKVANKVKKAVALIKFNKHVPPT